MKIYGCFEVVRHEFFEIEIEGDDFYLTVESVRNALNAGAAVRGPCVDGEHVSETLIEIENPDGFVLDAEGRIIGGFDEG